MSWVEAVPALLAAAVVLLGPGLAATAPLRMGVLARIAVSGLVGVVCSGSAAVVFGAAGLPFQAWQTLVPAVIGFGASWSIRRRRPALTVSSGRLPRLLLGLLWAASAVAIGIVAFAGVPSPDRISQTYDNVFHLSAVSAILDGFSASPLTLRSLIETDSTGIAFYPSAWHLLVVQTVQLSGSSVPVAFNAVWLAVQALVWLPGIAWLAQTVLPRSGTAALVALPLGAAFGWFPYALLSWGTIYPTGLAHSLLPAAVALTVVALRAPARAPLPAVPQRGDTPQDGGRAGGKGPFGLFTARRSAGRSVLLRLVAVGVAVIAIALAHPRVLPTWGVIGLPFLCWWLARLFRSGWRRGGWARRRAVAWLIGGAAAFLLVAATGFAYAVMRLGLFDEPLEDRLEGPQAIAVQGLGDGILQVLGARAMTGEGQTVTAVAPLLGLAVVVGLIVALRSPRTRWLAVSFVLVAGLFVLAAGSDGAIAKIATGLWYKDRFRLAAAIPVAAVPLAALGIQTAAAWAVSRWHRWRGRAVRRRIAVAVAGVVSLSSVVGLALTGTTSAVSSAFALPADDAQWEIASRKQLDFLRDEVSAIVPDDQLVLGDPWDGTTLSWLYAGREPVFPHVNGQWDPDRLVLAYRLQDIETDPAVCEALDALRVRYVLYNPHAFGGGDPAGNHFPGPHAAVEAGLFIPVATDGESTLYRIDQCGQLP